MTVESGNFTKFMDRHEIDAAVLSLANQLNRDYGKNADGQVVLVGVLKGAVLFVADLIRQLKFNPSVDFVRMQRQGPRDKTPGTVSMIKDLSLDILGKHVLIVEEIVDSGRCLKHLYERIRSAQPASVEVVSLLDKQDRRIVDVPVKYVGRKVSSEFFVGYGLDLEEKSRNLPHIFFLKYPN